MYFFMKLYVLRHGKAEKAKQGVKDFDKKLEENGILQAIKMGDYLKDVKIDQIICSSAVRTFETEAIVNEFLKIDNVVYLDELYLASSQVIKEAICDMANGTNVLYIGHNFGISDMVSELCEQDITMSTCMLAEIDILVERWDLLMKGAAQLINVTEPNQL
mgnify:CR=1 FL=1